MHEMEKNFNFGTLTCMNELKQPEVNYTHFVGFGIFNVIITAAETVAHIMELIIVLQKYPIDLVCMRIYRLIV